MANMYEPRLMGLTDNAPAPASTQAINAALSTVTVLLIDDEPIMTEVTQTYLEEAGYTRFVAINDPFKALAAALNCRPGIILLDLMMAGVSGFELLRQFRSHERLRYTPVIVMTAATDARSKLRALELGATEILAKPVDPSELAIRVRNSLAFKIYQDRLANEDPLTGLPNRRVFVEQVTANLMHQELHNNGMAVLHINLDRFRLINESLGHAVGDRLLSSVGDRLFACARQNVPRFTGRSGGGNVLARLGADEFALVLTAFDGPDQIAKLSRSILAAMAVPMNVEGHELVVTTSLGAAIFPQDGEDAATLMRNASVAMKHAKDSGRNTFHFYGKELNTAALERLVLENQLRGALQRKELELHYQPKVSLMTGKVIGAEALMRWRHPEWGMVPPGRFIPVAEECGLIVELGEWVVHTACAQMAQWFDETGIRVKVAVNVARHGLVSGELARVVAKALSNHAIEPQQLVLELTESMLMDRVDDTAAKLHELRALGAELSIDDFGTGYSSMSYLKQFPVQELKIDRSFINGMPHDRTDSAIVRALVVLAHSLDMRVVAEGVERDNQRLALERLGCDSYQGFLCSPAVPPKDFATLLLACRGRPSAERPSGQTLQAPLDALDTPQPE
jgi:diguanylate cyclase